MNRKIHVTESHIAKGQTLNCEDCPIGLAIKDSGIFEMVHVGYDIISVKLPNQVDNYECPTPKSVKRFMVSFDTNKSVRPFNFLLSDIIKPGNYKDF